jgi:cell division protein FtsI/penicillin-binding protein 2
MALVLEDAESGGHTAAPVAGQILAAIFQKKAESVSGSNVYAD